MHPQPRLLTILTCLALLQTAPTPATAAATSCAPRTCGNLTIAYPFWIPRDQPSNSSSSTAAAAPCGPPAFQVDCRGDGRASLALSFRGGYKILRVSYNNRTVVVANDNIQTDALSGCPVPRVDVSASLSLAPFTASRANAQLVFLFNCSTTPPAGFVGVTCPGTPAVVRLDPVYNTTAARAVAAGCDYSVVPVLPTPGASAGEYPRLLRGGYLLEWRASAGNCTACNASGGTCGYDSDTDAFACVCADGSSHQARCGAKKSAKKVIILIVSSLVSSGVLLAFLILIFIFRRQIRSSRLFSVMNRSSRDTANVEKLLQKHGALAPKRYRYSELKAITKSFKHKLGEGGYGAVFRGALNDGDRRAVAVKVLHNSRPDNGEEEFLNEVISIGRTSHVNVVTLLGFCLEGSARALVYEYMPNGSLDRYIYSSKKNSGGESSAPALLGWEALHEVAVGVARGLEYLHEGCNTRIVHFDIKPHNVLLDSDFRPKIADFGMAKLCRPKESVLSMADARGTVGFIAPEVFSRGFGVVSTKSDVYSYGMLLLEMVGGGRSNVRAYAEKTSSGDLFFPLWVYDSMLEDGAGVLREDEVARRMALVGLWCIQTVPASRPSMSRVLEMLERSVHELAMPPRPYHPSLSNSPSPSHPSSYPSITSASDITQRSRSRTPESTRDERLGDTVAED